MYSPFPGMDPYLERPGRWGGVHAGLMAVIGEVLTRQVAPRFFVDSDYHYYALGHDDPALSWWLRPDIYMVEMVGASTGSLSLSHGGIVAPTVIERPASLEVRAPYLKVIDTVDREVVTTIEVLSPINKVPGSSGQRDFLRKREQIMRSSTHWLEIDLLRAGTRPPDIPPQGDYDAVLHRTGDLNRLEAWFTALRNPLPTIAVPLRPPFEDVPLDLQEAVDTVYDRYRYDAGIDYDEEPPAPPLRAADAAWARDCIAKWRKARGD